MAIESTSHESTCRLTHSSFWGDDSARPRVNAAALHERFWTQFHEYMANRDPSIKLGKPSNRSIGKEIPGPGPIRLVLWNVLSGTSGIWVRLTGPGAESWFDRIDDRLRSQLKEQLSPLGEVVWLPKDSKGSLLSLRRPSQIFRLETWPELNEWMARTLENLLGLLGTIPENFKPAKS